MSHSQKPCYTWSQTSAYDMGNFIGTTLNAHQLSRWATFIAQSSRLSATPTCSVITYGSRVALGPSVLLCKEFPAHMEVQGRQQPHDFNQPGGKWYGDSVSKTRQYLLSFLALLNGCVSVNNAKYAQVLLSHCQERQLGEKNERKVQATYVEEPNEILSFPATWWLLSTWRNQMKYTLSFSLHRL
jgi:hypothetical protein